MSVIRTIRVRGCGVRFLLCPPLVEVGGCLGSFTLNDLRRLRDDINEALALCEADEDDGARSLDECGCSCGAVSNWTPLLKEVQAGVHGTKACHPAGW